MITHGHLGISLLLYAPIAYVLVRNDRERVMAGGLLAVLLLTPVPDVDFLVPGLSHRGVTHSVAAAVSLGLGAGVVGSAGGSVIRIRWIERVAFSFGAGVFGVGSHLVGDVITPMGIRPFYPVSSAWYTLDLVSARDPGANIALFGIGMLVFMMTLRRADAYSLPLEPGGEGRVVDSTAAPRQPPPMDLPVRSED